MTLSLSQEAKAVVDAFQNIAMGNKTIACPYFNNKRHGVRGGLRVLVGKGSPKDIEEEALLISLRDKIDLSALPEERLTQFLVDHHIGIDCSGFAFYVLREEAKAKKLGGLRRHLSFPHAWNPIRNLLTKTRPVENVNVALLAHPKNSADVALKDIQPADMIVMQKTGNAQFFDHVLVVSQVERNENNVVLIQYVHSLQWQADGKYKHGVRSGTIRIVNESASLLEAEWEEQGMRGEKNETFARARDAREFSIRRLRIFG